ncbi:hypothetical protein G6F23_015265 [Rhizopus arrhizus]|nr:hypothetical protein G6F23_015265 [Rhizopus arrhizus]
MRGHAACAPGRRSSQATAVAAASAAAIHISGEAADAAATGIAPVAAITTAPLLAGAVEPVRALMANQSTWPVFSAPWYSSGAVPPNSELASA